jgi:PTS system ascorbate-specific IIA component
MQSTLGTALAVAATMNPMIGLFLITHTTYGESLIQCACHVLNQRPPQIVQLGVALQDDPLDLLPQAREMLRWVDSGKGVLVMTDIFGATPSNIAMKLLEPGRIDGVAGVNLPMLVRALTYREKDMATLIAKAISGGRDGVLNLLKH